jgi:hypothetical protein
VRGQVEIKVQFLFVEAGLDGVVGGQRDAKVEEIDGPLTGLDYPSKFTKAGDSLEVGLAGGVSDGIRVRDPDTKAVVNVADKVGKGRHMMLMHTMMLMHLMLTLLLLGVVNSYLV